MSLDALQDFLPLARTLDVKTVRYDTRKVAKRLEAELGDAQSGCLEGDPSAWERLPLPEGVFTVGIDGGDVRTWWDKKQHCAVMVGKSILSFQEEEEARTPSRKRLGFVQTLETQSTRRLYEVLQSQGLPRNQEITCLADGDDTRRTLQMEMSPQATPILAWFHRTMPLTVLGQFGKGLVPCAAGLGEQGRDQIECLPWSLWHGQVDKALGKIDALKASIAPCEAMEARFPRLVKALAELRTSIVHNRHVIPHDGERSHHGEATATGFVESTGKEVVRRRFCKQQPMQWSTEGAHVLLQTRGRTLNGELGVICKRWYPDMDLEGDEVPVAA